MGIAHTNEIILDKDPVEPAIVNTAAHMIAEKYALHRAIHVIADNADVGNRRRSWPRPSLDAIGMIAVADALARRIKGSNVRSEIAAAIAFDENFAR